MDQEAVKSVFLPSHEDCLEYLRRKRWKEGIRCLYCGSSNIWSDGFTPKEVKEHKVVNHNEREWAKGETHVNGCENRNGFLRAYLRRYRGVSKKYLQSYLDFLSLILNEKGGWFSLLLSDNLWNEPKV